MVNNKLFLKVNTVFGNVIPMILVDGELKTATRFDLINLGLFDTELQGGLNFSKVSNKFSNGKFVIKQNWLGFFVIRIGEVPDTDVMHSFYYRKPSLKEVIRYTSSFNNGFLSSYDLSDDSSETHDNH